jgi:hypothetical protein
MITRRTVLGTGIALASAAVSVGFAAAPALARGGQFGPKFDAILIDQQAVLPREISAALLADHPRLPVVAVHLDAASHADLMRVFAGSKAIVGVSTGATLFCLERMAWDHGYRLTERMQHCGGDFGAAQCQQDLAAFLNGAQLWASKLGHPLQGYRPSRADDMLHIWAMRKSDAALLRQARREGTA